MLPLIVPFLAGKSIAEDTDIANDMRAMNSFMANQTPQTSKAEQLKTQWNIWFSDLSWYERNLDEESWKEARNRIADYKLANARNAAERETAERLQKQALDIENQMAAEKGKSLPVDTTTGRFTIAEKDTSTPIKFKWVVLGSTVAVGSALGAYVAPTVKLKTPLALTSLAALLTVGTYTAFKIDV